jgi:hypothetical protein
MAPRHGMIEPTPMPRSRDGHFFRRLIVRVRYSRRRRVQDIHQRFLSSGRPQALRPEVDGRLPGMCASSHLTPSYAHRGILPSRAASDGLPGQVDLRPLRHIVNVTPFEPGGRATSPWNQHNPLPARIYANGGIAQVLFFGADELAKSPTPTRASTRSSGDRAAPVGQDALRGRVDSLEPGLMPCWRAQRLEAAAGIT